MNDLKPVFAWCKASKNAEEQDVVDLDCACPECVLLYAIPSTHRIVSVGLLENIAQTLGKCGYFRGDIRAIIDNKEQQ